MRYRTCSRINDRVTVPHPYHVPSSRQKYASPLSGNDMGVSLVNSLVVLAMAVRIVLFSHYKLRQTLVYLSSAASAYAHCLAFCCPYINLIELE